MIESACIATVPPAAHSQLLCCGHIHTDTYITLDTLPLLLTRPHYLTMCKFTILGLVFCLLSPSLQDLAKGLSSPHSLAAESLFSFDDSTLYKISWLEAPDESNNSKGETANKVYTLFFIHLSLSNKCFQIDGEQVLITSTNKEQYRCFIPNVDKKVCFLICHCILFFH